MTVDGFVGGPNGEMDWMSFNWDDKLGIIGEKQVGIISVPSLSPKQRLLIVYAHAVSNKYF